MRQRILGKLKLVRQRLWIVSILDAAVRGLSLGAFFAAGLAVLRFGSVGDFSAPFGLIALIGVPLLAVIAAGVGCLLQADWLSAARAVDRRYDLKDRTETALAFLNRQQSGAVSPCEELLFNRTRLLRRFVFSLS